MQPSLCAIQRERDARQFPTLGIFKPGQITGFTIEPAKQPNWTPEQMNALRQIPLFQTAPADELEKIPFDFKYHFRCNESECTGHHLTCFDWEMGVAYRNWRRRHGDNWQQVFRETFETKMMNKNDTHFFVGNQHQAPTAWIIVGLFYPPKTAMNDLFG
jgi:hypothetical protein